MNGIAFEALPQRALILQIAIQFLARIVLVDIRRTARRNCEGCAVNHPSQSSHDCLSLSQIRMSLLFAQCYDRTVDVLQEFIMRDLKKIYNRHGLMVHTLVVQPNFYFREEVLDGILQVLTQEAD